ncbi:hypothetical protein [Acetobacter sp.]|uniref:hypothetical protein n=1 Tax=Acetobacter sp. TaxID=440 RepID=UPI0039EA74B3
MTSLLAKEKRDEILGASVDIAHLASLARWAGRGLIHAPECDLSNSTRCEAGEALLFLGEEIERRCAVIDEAL